jgi:hypothetical protein
MRHGSEQDNQSSGAPIGAADVKMIVDYLAPNYGKQRRPNALPALS